MMRRILTRKRSERDIVDNLFFCAAQSDGMSDEEVREALESEGVNVDEAAAAVKKQLQPFFDAARRGE